MQQDRGEQLRAWFSDVVEEHYQSLFWTARRYLRDDDQAQDIVQSSVLRGFERIAALEDPSKVVGWLRRIVRNQCLDHLARKKRLRRSGEDVSDIDPSAEAPQAPVHEDEVADLNAALEQLAPQQRELLQLRFVKGLTPTEIAGQLGIKPGAARVRLHRAVLKLQHGVVRLRGERTA